MPGALWGEGQRGRGGWVGSLGEGRMRRVSGWPNLAPSREPWAGVAGCQDGQGKGGCVSHTKVCEVLATSLKVQSICLAIITPPPPN